MIQDLLRIISFPAIAPQNGGKGEWEKARELEKLLLERGLPQPEWYVPEDPTDGGVRRPNLVVRIPGRTDRKLYIVTHMDVVPEGDLSAWDMDPFRGKVMGERIYGRGVNDNGQELIASIYAVMALQALGIRPSLEICLCFVADEETGSTYGIQHLIERGLFSPEDLVIVPDGGNSRGDFVEIAEKGILWISFTVKGQQCHASMPHMGLNACRVANQLSFELDRALHKAFPDEDDLFDPPVSTMEPTRRKTNVGSINIIPGKEEFSFDCRVLPSISLDTVLEVVEEKCREVAHLTKADITYEILQRNDPAQPTRKDSDVLGLLCRSIEETYSFSPEVGGIGGGTCAAFFRKSGIPAVVWAHEADVAHMPNEYCEMEHLLKEAEVFAAMMKG
ncbi:MAG: M20 family metallo-hydrolase [Synergistales bacterium]|nr:M20 family metallo-hydrolase [Synergistales bacterium]